MRYKLLVVEDDLVIREELQLILQNQGYDVIIAADFSHICEQLQTAAPHLLLLDINLPSENGFSLCSKIRRFSNIPIIFVTARVSEMDELNSILLGGDAFITKPYNISILLAKISFLLKRAYPHADPFLICGDVTLHLESSKLEYHQKQVDLTKNELKILYYLLKRPNKICPRIEIIDYLWDQQLYIDDNALSVNITRIREKLTQLGLSHFIKTKHRQGYIICI